MKDGRYEQVLSWRFGPMFNEVFDVSPPVLFRTSHLHPTTNYGPNRHRFLTEKLVSYAIISLTFAKRWSPFRSDLLCGPTEESVYLLTKTVRAILSRRGKHCSKRTSTQPYLSLFSGPVFVFSQICSRRRQKSPEHLNHRSRLSGWSPRREPML